MAPTRWPPPPLLLLFLFAAAAAATATTEDASGPPPSPTPWPERFHAVMFTNLTNYSVASTGPPLRITDLYYDWPRRRNLNLVRHQLSADPLYDVEWNNGTSFYFDSSTCRVERFPVGVLPPWWLSGGGAEYMGRGVTGGIECHVWGKAGFIVYYEEASTGRPVRWNFIDVTGIEQFVMSFEPGVVLEDAQWQAPAHCFPDDSEEQGKGNDHVASSSDEVWDGLAVASRLLRKLAGTAAKEVQAEKNKQRAKEKKEQIESVKKWRKQRQQGGFAKGNDDVPDLNFEGEEGFKQSKKKRPGVSPSDRSGGLAKRGKEGNNRRSRDAKFGHGGRKGLKKQNTAETTNDFRSFNKGGESQNKKRKRS